MAPNPFGPFPGGGGGGGGCSGLLSDIADEAGPDLRNIGCEPTDRRKNGVRVMQRDLARDRLKETSPWKVTQQHWSTKGSRGTPVQKNMPPATLCAETC